MSPCQSGAVWDASLDFFGINLIFMELKWGVYLSAVFSRIISFEEQNTMSLSPIPPRRIVTCSCLSDGNFFVSFQVSFLAWNPCE